MKLVVSSCLMGINCKYSGGNNASQELLEYVKEHEVLMLWVVCRFPEHVLKSQDHRS